MSKKTYDAAMSAWVGLLKRFEAATNEFGTRLYRIKRSDDLGSVGVETRDMQIDLLNYTFDDFDNLTTDIHQAHRHVFDLGAELAAAEKRVEELSYAADLAKAERHPLHDPSVRAKVWALTDGHCAYCGSQLEPDKTNGFSGAFCVEHVVPRAAGGPDNIANYVPSCLGCNSAKGDRHVLVFIRGALARRTALTVVSGDAA